MRGHGEKKSRKLDAFIAGLLSCQTVEDAAAAAGISTATAYRWLHDQDVIERLRQAQGVFPAVINLEGPRIGPPAALSARTEALIRLASQLKDEALRPIPSLPPHAPPYLVEPPGHDLAGTKAVLLATGIEELANEIRNIMLAEANSALP